MTHQPEHRIRVGWKPILGEHWEHLVDQCRKKKICNFIAEESTGQLEFFLEVQELIRRSPEAREALRWILHQADLSLEAGRSVSMANQTRVESDNDWTWLSSVLSRPNEFTQLGMSKYRNQHIAVFEKRIWCSASDVESAAEGAIRLIAEETGRNVKRTDLVLYFCG